MRFKKSFFVILALLTGLVILAGLAVGLFFLIRAIVK